MGNSKSLRTVLASTIGCDFSITFPNKRIKAAHFYFQLVFAGCIN